MTLCTRAIIVVSILLPAFPSFAQPTEWDRAWWFREQVGMAPTDLAALGLAPEAQEALITAVREHFATHAETDGVVIDRLTAAKRQVTAVTP